ncbi:hypothetical protein TNCV_2813961 [Trichonephila clavipes]|nr:hypothetical protein TNCV_2813961 [Trichonephila clavipes]
MASSTLAVTQSVKIMLIVTLESEDVTLMLDIKLSTQATIVDFYSTIRELPRLLQSDIPIMLQGNVRCHAAYNVTKTL